MKVSFVTSTPDAEKITAYIARVSNPSNQENPDYAKLLAYCIKHGHWSVFEQAFMTVEIETTVGIAPQILRHRSFVFQQFSARYAEVTDFELQTARRQHDKNRQLSVDDLPQEDKDWFVETQGELWAQAKKSYDEAIKRGIAKECARFLLPQMAATRMYMSGNLRSYIHYIELRTKEGVQKEHKDIALAIKSIFIEKFPVISEALLWK